MWTEFIYQLGDLFQWAFGFFEFVQNYFNNFLIVLGFFGFGYWMNIQNKLSKKANVSVESSENTGWYKDESKKLK
jgi:hypothetical protein